MPTTVACLGWGSLVWDPRDLPIRQRWVTTGPLVKAEFLRESRDKRITLVLHDSAAAVQSLWCLMAVDSLDEATDRLASREGISKSNVSIHVGRWSHGAVSPRCINELDLWASLNRVEHVVWTALPPKIGGAEKCATCDEVLMHLSGLEGSERDNAERYVRRAPAQIDTAYRRAIAAQLSWTPIRDPIAQ
jgi:hypothetical protein